MIFTANSLIKQCFHHTKSLTLHIKRFSAQYATIISLATASIVGLGLPSVSHAEKGIVFGTQGQQLPSAEDRGKVSIRDLNWMNNNFLDKQRVLAEGILRSKYGRQFQQNSRDLKQIQRLIDSGELEDADVQTLQAFGAIIGDVIENEHRKLNWKVYEDKIALSHAVCLEDTEHCIFPMTLLSRRMAAGVTPDVQKIFDKVMTSMRKHYARLPYSGQEI